VLERRAAELGRPIGTEPGQGPQRDVRQAPAPGPGLSSERGLQQRPGLWRRTQEERQLDLRRVEPQVGAGEQQLDTCLLLERLAELRLGRRWLEALAEGQHRRRPRCPCPGGDLEVAAGRSLGGQLQIIGSGRLVVAEQAPEVGAGEEELRRQPGGIGAGDPIQLPLGTLRGVEVVLDQRLAEAPDAHQAPEGRVPRGLGQGL